MTTDEAIDRDIRLELARGLAKGTVREDDPMTAIRHRVSSRRVRRQRRSVLGGIGVLVALIVVTGSVLGRDAESEDVRASDQGTTTTDAPSPGRPMPPVPPGGALPSPPLEVRGDAAVVWTGREVVVWGGDVEALNMGLPGGDRAYTDGAAFDPGTGQWRELSPSPLPASPATTLGVRVDAGVLFVRGSDAALWDPDSDTWQSVDDAPATVDDLSSTGNGAISYSANAVLDPTSGTWETLPDPPLQLERPTTVWDGSELIVIGGPSTPFADAAAIAYDPDMQRWRTLPDPPSGLSAAALSADFDGERVVVVNYDMRAAAYAPTSESWTPLPDVPARFSEWYPTLRSTADPSSIAFMAHAAVFLDDGDRWIPLPYTDVAYGQAVSADGVGGPGILYVFGFDSDGQRNVFTSIVPSEAIGDPDQVQVGVYTVDLPEDVVFGSAAYSSGVPAPGESVRAEVQTPAGICVLVAGFGADPILDPISETLNGMNWARDETGHAWALDTSSTDALRIDCDDADDGRALASSVLPPFQ